MCAYNRFHLNFTHALLRVHGVSWTKERMFIFLSILPNANSEQSLTLSVSCAKGEIITSLLECEMIVSLIIVSLIIVLLIIVSSIIVSLKTVSFIIVQLRIQYIHNYS